MGKLDHLDREELQKRLDDASSAKTAKRLVIALAYIDDVPVTTLTRRYGIPRSTIYHWLNTLENEPLDEALEDDERPGRPSKLSEDQQEHLETVLGSAPTDVGIDQAQWSPWALRQYINAEFGVEYSLSHTRRLLNQYDDES